MSNNRDEVQGMAKGDYKRSRIAEMMKHRFLGGGPVEPPDVDYSIIMGEKAHALMEYGLTWVGWLEKYSQYDKGEGEATPIFQQTVVEELTMANAKAQGTWLEDEDGDFDAGGGGI